MTWNSDKYWEYEDSLLLYRPQEEDVHVIPNKNTGAPSLGTTDDPWFGLQVVTAADVRIIGDDSAARTITIGQSGTYTDAVEIGGDLECKESVTCKKSVHIGDALDPQAFNVFGETLMTGNLIVQGSQNTVQMRVSASGTQTSANVVQITDSGGTAKVVVDKDFNLGIGTATPAELLDVAGNAHIDETLTVDRAAVFNAEGGNYDVQIKGENNDNLFFADADVDRIGIGTNAPRVLLHVSDGGPLVIPASSDIAIIQNNSAADDDCAINIIAGTEGKSTIRFGDYDSPNAASFEFDHSNSPGKEVNLKFHVTTVFGV